jgi:hypothetical protein
VAYAQHEFWLASTDAKGISNRAHFEAVEKQGIHVPELEGPPIPEGMESTWAVFTDLHAARQAGMGPLPIAWRDVDAYIRVTGRVLYHWQIEAIRRLDRAWMESNG